LVQGAGRLKQMRRAGDDGELLLAAERRQRRAVERDHPRVRASDDEQGRRQDASAARSGRPPRETTAAAWSGRSAAHAFFRTDQLAKLNQTATVGHDRHPLDAHIPLSGAHLGSVVDIEQ
jgi:hypothetical protein